MNRLLFCWIGGSALAGLLLTGCADSPESLTSASEQAPQTSETASDAQRSDPPFPPPEGMVWIPGGTFQMGCEILDGGMPDEGPVHSVELDGFYIDKTEVTNAQFQKFVEATGYVTMAERKPELRSLKADAPELKILRDERFQKPGSMCLNPKLQKGNLDPEKGAYAWWDYIPGANWRQPEGPGSSIKDRMDHPVVHVAWLDAKAYCDWAGKKLPTEAQWEYAARGGPEQRVYPWGNVRNPKGKWLHNIWQGNFPLENTEEDGYRGTAPVGSFQPNGFGLYDTSGNVWEWVADYYRPDYYRNSPRKNPPGPESSLDPLEPFIIKRVQRGGSFMCSDSYCIAYRNSARMKGEQDTGAFHTGFRCVATPAMLKERMKADTP